MTFRPFLSILDPSSAIPASASSRHDRLGAAITSLEAEQRRLQRLGLEPALTECRLQLRYWEFVRAILALPPSANLDPRPARRGAR